MRLMGKYCTIVMVKGHMGGGGGRKQVSQSRFGSPEVYSKSVYAMKGRETTLATPA